MKMTLYLNQKEVCSGVFNIFVDQWFVKKCNNLFKLTVRDHAFPNIPDMLETHAQKKKINFQHYCETKMSQIVFW